MAGYLTKLDSIEIPKSYEDLEYKIHNGTEQKRLDLLRNIEVIAAKIFKKVLKGA